jgi:hypothetical protein
MGPVIVDATVLTILVTVPGACVHVDYGGGMECGMNRLIDKWRSHGSDHTKLPHPTDQVYKLSFLLPPPTLLEHARARLGQGLGRPGRDERGDARCVRGPIDVLG